MSKASSKDLFHLIKALTKSEKRYFKVMASVHFSDENNTYIKLFDAIDRQKEYDEKKLLKHFNRLSLLKGRLYDAILKRLNSYHSESSVTIQLKNYLYSIEVLYGKRLYSQCEKLIAKAKLLAMKHDLQLPLLELLKWEVEIIKMQSFIDVNEDKIREVFNSIFSSIEQYKTTNEYILHISLLLLMIMKTGNIRSSSDIKALKMIMDNPLFRVPEQELSFHSLDCFYAVHGVYFSMQNDYLNANTFYQKQVQLLEVNPHQITENPLRYFYAMSNLFVGNLYLKQYQECADIIEKLRKLQVKSLNVRKYICFMTEEMNLSLCIETGTFNKGIEWIQSREGGWDNKDSTIINKGEILSFQYNTAYLYFGVGNYRKANECLNQLLNEPVDTRNDVQCFALILSLLTHFELGNQNLLEYRVKSVYRFLNKRNRLYKVENLILEFIRKELPKIHSDKELLTSFDVLLTKMKPLSADPFERRLFDYFDFISWLECKIEGRAFAEIVREKKKQPIAKTYSPDS